MPNDDRVRKVLRKDALLLRQARCVRFHSGERALEFHRSAHHAGQHVFGLGLLLHVRRGDGLLAGLDDGFERFAFVGGVALDRFDEVWNQVVTALELHVDL
jgi:hypothetical protein